MNELVQSLTDLILAVNVLWLAVRVGRLENRA